MSTLPFNEPKYGVGYSATPTAEPVADAAIDEYAYAKTGEDANTCRDVFWTILFYIHLGAVIAAVIMNLQDIEKTPEEEDAMNGIVWLFIVTSVTSIVLSTGALALMNCCLNQMIKAGLIFSVAMSLLVGMFGFMTGQWMIGIFGVLSFLVGACYAKLVWSRIPFAEANLKTALLAVQANWGLGTWAYGTVLLALVWSNVWFLAFGSSIYTSNWGLLFGLLFSYYW
ncbi:MAG: hypothetical protein SGARI_007140, partial [Bacillariaceae sp.]